MKIYTNNAVFYGTVAELIAHLGIKSHPFIMFTLTTKPNSEGDYQFRAWTTPFCSYAADHVDTGEQEGRLFSILHGNRDEILSAVASLLEGKQRWKPDIGDHVITMWLAYQRY